MTQASRMAAGFLVVASLTAAVWVRGQSPTGKYHGAKLRQAGQIAYPMNSQQPGFVTLDVRVDSSGSVQNVAVVRDVPPLTAAVQSSLNGWQFSPAKMDGQTIAGVVGVTVAFNPYNPSGVGLPGESLQPASSAATGDFHPAQVQKAHYAIYPPNTVASGAVVLNVRVGADGAVHSVTSIGDKRALTTPSVNAVQTWTFAPATYKGQAVPSDVAVIFVFASPEAGTR
jgi:outer membrane biosynthesis protein TonB